MSSVVQHGRRAGRSRGSTPNQQFEMTGEGLRPKMNQRDLNQVTILTKDDWDRIQYQLNRKEIEQEKIRKQREERERLHEMSKDRVKTWTNTIKGASEKKLDALRQRRLKEEEEKKAIDIEEAKYRAQKRKEAIETAKTQQYYQTDRVKRFHSALQLTEVLKEREAQLELKQLMANAGRDIDAHYFNLQQQEYDRSILQDQKKAEKRMKDARENAKFQKTQIHQHLREQDKQRQDDITEGEELKRLAVQYDMETKKLKEIKHQEAQQTLSDNLKQIDDVEKMRKLNNMQEEEEDEECRIFAAAKRKMMQLRAEKEAELNRKKQEKLARIKDRLTAQMQQQKDDEDERIKRALEETEARREKEEAAKQAKLSKGYREMAEDRTQQMEKREKAAAAARKAELEDLLMRKEADALFQRNEAEKSKRRHEEQKDLKNFHSQQLNERQMKEAKARDAQLELDRKNLELLTLEEKQFQEYATKVIDHAEKGGRNTLPLRKAAKDGGGGGLGPQFPGKGGLRPSYMTADQQGVQLPYYQCDGTENTKKMIDADANTGQRLGFVW